MSLKKQYSKSKKACKVTFYVPRDASMGASTVNIVGDFNNWSVTGNPMQKLKTGGFTLTLELGAGQEYQFRYLMVMHCVCEVGTMEYFTTRSVP